MQEDDLATLLDVLLINEWNNDRILHNFPFGHLDALVREKDLLLPGEEDLIILFLCIALSQMLYQILLDLYPSQRLNVKGEHLKLLLVDDV